MFRSGAPSPSPSSPSSPSSPYSSPLSPASTTQSPSSTGPASGKRGRRRLDSVPSKLDRVARRRLQNRNAAATSRNRKKSALRELEDEVHRLKQETVRLGERLARTEEENCRLRSAHGTSSRATGQSEPLTADDHYLRDAKRLCVDGGHRGVVGGVKSESSHELADRVSHSVIAAFNDDESPVSRADADDTSDAAVGESFIRGVLHEFAILTSPQWKTPIMTRNTTTTANATLISQRLSAILIAVTMTTAAMTIICSAHVLMTIPLHSLQSRRIHR